MGPLQAHSSLGEQKVSNPGCRWILDRKPAFLTSIYHTNHGATALLRLQKIYICKITSLEQFLFHNHRVVRGISNRT